MKKINKRVSLLLALLLMSSCVAGCGSDETAETESTNIVLENSETETENSDLPIRDFDGYEFHILTYWPHIYEVEELTGEAVNDSKYDRQIYMSDVYNTKIKPIQGIGTRELLDDSLRAAVTAGDDIYDLAVPHPIVSGPGFIADNMVLDVKTVPYINLKQPWWNQRQNETLAINDKLFFFGGYLNMPLPFCMFMNKAYLEDYELGDIYSIVNEYKWTLDLLTEMSVATAVDLNGDGQMTSDTDQFGFGCNDDNTTLNFMFSSGMVSVLINDKGKPEPNVYNEKMQSLVESIYYLTHESKSAIFDTYQTQYNGMIAAYREGRVLCRAAGFDELQGLLRDSDIDTAVIPYPMWDEDQGYYATHCDATYGIFCIPVTASDVERTGIIVEAMAEYTYEYCIPALYEVTLGTKSVSDPESSKMVDLIFDSIVYDFGYIFDNWLGCTWTLPNLMKGQGSTDLTSYWKGIENIINQHYEDLYNNAIS